MGNYSNHVTAEAASALPAYVPASPRNTLIQLRYGYVTRLDALRRAGTVVGALRVETAVPWVPYRMVTALRVDPSDRVTAENPDAAMKKAEAIAQLIGQRWAQAGYQIQLVESEPIDTGMAVDEEYINLSAVALPA